MLEVVVIHIKLQYPAATYASRVIIHWGFPQIHEGLMICDHCEKNCQIGNV
jgi:hypothetical protein